MILETATLLVLSIASGVLYHLGGVGKPYPTKLRDWGCSLCLILCLWIFKGPSWWYILTFGLSWIALSSYWKGKSVDMKWYHWGAHGLGCGLAALPLGFTLGASYRIIFCTAAMIVVSEFSDDVAYEEFWRGFVFCASVIFLLTV